MPARSPAQATPPVERRTTPRRVRVVDHPVGTAVHHRADPVPGVDAPGLSGGQPPEIGGGWTTIAAGGTIVSRPVYGGSKGGPSWATGSSIRITRKSNSPPGTWA